MCDRVGVMYAGEIVERGSLTEVFDETVHPYTKGLLGSVPDLDDPAPRLNPIEGNVPELNDEEMGDRCYFADRCPKAMDACLDHPPELSASGDGHLTRCVLAEMAYDPSRALPDDYFADPETQSRTDADQTEPTRPEEATDD
jgi:peptide/nickel transport system ATP-binding protein